MHPLTVAIKMSRGHRLDWAAEKQVGYGWNEEVVIKEKAQKTLHRYDLQKNELIYQEIWNEDFPHSVNTASIIAVRYYAVRYVD